MSTNEALSLCHRKRRTDEEDPEGARDETVHREHSRLFTKRQKDVVARQKRKTLDRQARAGLLSVSADNSIPLRKSSSARVH